MNAKAPSAWQMEQAMSALMSARARLHEFDVEEIEAGFEDARQEAHAAEQGAIPLLHSILRSAVECSDQADAADARAKSIMERRDRYRRRVQELRSAAFAAMEVLDMKRVELPDLTASIAAGQPSVVITNEAAIPSEYTRTKTEPDKAKIGADLKVGVVIPGAELSNGLPSLRIRT